MLLLLGLLCGFVFFVLEEEALLLPVLLLLEDAFFFLEDDDENEELLLLLLLLAVGGVGLGVTNDPFVVKVFDDCFVDDSFGMLLILAAPAGLNVTRRAEVVVLASPFF